MVYSFARIGAAIGMRVEDVYPQNRRLWLRLHEKGGKEHAMPCHHNLEPYLHEYLDGAGLANEPKAILFQTYSRATGQLTGAPLPQANDYAMIQRRAGAAGIKAFNPKIAGGAQGFCEQSARIVSSAAALGGRADPVLSRWPRPRSRRRPVISRQGSSQNPPGPIAAAPGQFAQAEFGGHVLRRARGNPEPGRDHADGGGRPGQDEVSSRFVIFCTVGTVSNWGVAAIPR